MYKSENKDIWRVFRKHHYLSGDFNKAADLYLIYWDDVLIGMNSVLNLPNGYLKHSFRSHRLVVLPDFQGLGFGTKINDFFGKYYLNKGYRYNMRTTHLRLIKHMEESNEWLPNSNNNKNNITSCIHNQKYSNIMSNDKMLKRVCASYEYVGVEYSKKPLLQLVIDTIDIDKEEFKEKLLNLKKNNYIQIVHGTTKSYDFIDEVCQELGIIIIPLYEKKNNVYQIRKKYQNSIIQNIDF